MLYEITVSQFTKMLQNLSRILDKGAAFADAKKIDMEVLLNSRLAPDQFNLLKQVQIVTDTAKLCAFRLTGKEAPVHDDKEKTLPELKTRIEQTLTYLRSLKPGDFEGAAQKKVSQPRWEGKYLMADEFVVQHAIPNVYFHITTAYAILRSNGVEVGKKDYLGEMPYKQP